MKRSWSIDKNLAPKDFKKFKRWYKAACNFKDVSVEEAYKSLGYKLPESNGSNSGTKKEK